MYGVIVKQTGDDFVSYVQQTFPNLNPEEIRKPDERIFCLTVEKLAVNPEDYLYIDVRRGYLEAAKRVGMNTILLIAEMYHMKETRLKVIRN